MLWASETFFLCIAKISNRDEFFSSFDFFPPIDWGHLLQGDRTHRCCDGASNGILVLEGKSNVILQIVSSFWMHTFRRLNCHVPQSIIWLSCCHFAPIMLWGLKHFLRVLSSCKWPEKEFGNIFFTLLVSNRIWIAWMMLSPSEKVNSVVQIIVFYLIVGWCNKFAGPNWKLSRLSLEIIFPTDSWLV